MKKTAEKDALIVLSGGMDSTTLLHEYKSRIALAVSFDYGSNHNKRELECAAWQCRTVGVEHIVIPLEFMKQYFRSALLNGADAIPDGEYAEENMADTVVPFRNAIMLAVATGLAESRQLSVVMLANHGGDHTIYADCRPEFVAAMNAAIVAGTDAKVSLECPYTHLSKSQIAQRGVALAVDYSHTYSCYKGLEHPCGHCATCRERHQALLDAGITDVE